MLLDSDKLNDLSVVNIRTLKSNKQDIFGSVVIRKIGLVNLSEVRKITIPIDGPLRTMIRTESIPGNRTLYIWYNILDTPEVSDRNTLEVPRSVVGTWYDGSSNNFNRVKGAKSNILETGGGALSIQWWARNLTSRVEVADFIIIDLTDAFGKGKEPDKDTMDKIIEKIGYFEQTEIYLGELI